MHACPARLHKRTTTLMLASCVLNPVLQERTARTLPPCLLQGVDDGSMVVPVQRYLDSKDGGRPLGVYCVYDAHGALQFVGYSRNMLLSIKARPASQHHHHSVALCVHAPASRAAACHGCACMLAVQLSSAACLLRVAIIHTP